MIDKRFKFTKWILPLFLITVFVFNIGLNPAIARTSIGTLTTGTETIDGGSTIVPPLTASDPSDYTINGHNLIVLESESGRDLYYSWYFTFQSMEKQKTSQTGSIGQNSISLPLSSSDDESNGLEISGLIDPVSLNFIDFEVVQVVQIWEPNDKDVLNVVAESTTQLTCGLRVPESAAHTDHTLSDYIEFVETTNGKGDMEWSISFIGKVGIGCQSLNLNTELHDLYQQLDPTADLYVCGSVNAGCSIPVTNIFVKTEADVTKPGPIFSYGPILFSLQEQHLFQAAEGNDLLSLEDSSTTTSGDIGTTLDDTTTSSTGDMMTMRLQVDDFFTTSSLLTKNPRNPIQYLEISQNDKGEFTHYLNEHNPPVVAQATDAPETVDFASVALHTTPIEGDESSIDNQYDVYFGYDPDSGSYLTDGIIRNGLFDPYSTCAGCGVR